MGPQRTAALLALLLVATAGCVAPSLAAGDCAAPDRDGRMERAECTDPAALRVLGISDVQDACYSVPGVTRSVSQERTSDIVEICLGPQDVDAATAVNVTKVGECLADGGSSAEPRMRRVDCTAQPADYRVLTVEDGAYLPSHDTDDCADVPGSTASYSWSLDDEQPSLGGFRRHRLFCLASLR